MSKLAADISVRPRFARSVNLERDIARSEPLDGYIVTTRALEVVERIAETAATSTAGGAWSLTGPYGSGKSSLALLIDAAFGADNHIRQIALQLIDETSPQVGKLIRDAHRRHDTDTRGFHQGLVTAGRDPITLTVLHALYSAVLRRYGRIPPRRTFAAAPMLKEALKDAKSDDPRCTGPSPSTLVTIARCLAEDAPLLLVIDEFGKNLEMIRDSGDTDPYLLQRLAEAGQGSGLPIFILTLQHLAFEDHIAGANNVQRREWAKVQGRFEDIAFIESAAQTRALIGTVFKVHNSSLQTRINRWARIQAKAMQELGIADLADSRTVASCYPLHPLTTLMLPELCNRYGQRERTLFSFLASRHAASASSFLTETDLPTRGVLPSVGLDAVYDYFVGNGALHIESARMSGRWAEIAVRLRDSHGLTPRQIRLAKAVALLNLVSMTGTIRASRALLALTSHDTEEILDELEEQGLVIYRDFADEYRVWQGTDVDIRLLLDMARRQVAKQSLVEILNEIDQPQPVVVARHSARYDVLRVFSRRYAGSGELVEPLGAFSQHDGEVLLIVDDGEELPTMTQTGEHLKPTVAAVPAELTTLDAAAREVATVQAVLSNPLVADDWVARSELGEQLAQTQVILDQALTRTFRSDSCRWVFLDTRDGRELSGGRGSAALSEAADIAYKDTPSVKNEMLNRTELTTQGAKARRLLLIAMIEHETKPDLGMKGYGPEMAMYQAFLKRTGLHDQDRRNKVMTFRKPKDESLKSVWETLDSRLKRSTRRRVNLTEIYAILTLPPYGMKSGAIPVFVTAALIAFSDEVAIYEHGTFKPILSVELSERMVRNPGHFDIKHFANTTGARRLVVDALARRFQLRPSFRKHRVSNVLTVIGHLVSRINRLDNYTRRTHNLKHKTVGARDILLKAVEPDELLFNSLPEALGFPPVPAKADAYAHADAYAASMGDVMDELEKCFGRMLGEQLDYLLRMSAETTRKAIMDQAAALEGKVFEPELKAFVLSLANNTVESSMDWIKMVATVVTKKAPPEWTDNDLLHFQSALHQQFSAFHRLVALHSEHSSNGGDLDAYRVIVTRSDGSEQARLVRIDQELKHEFDDAFEDALRSFTSITGSRQRAHHTLLALIGEQLLPVVSMDDTNETNTNTSRSGISQNGSEPRTSHKDVTSTAALREEVPHKTK
ncbi:MAG: hypothetical protein OXI96_07345 [Acidimicrobiaceae bacterium]|nr:hypothetical protein [Acidimicrobiaceae bacterium]